MIKSHGVQTWKNKTQWDREQANTSTVMKSFCKYAEHWSLPCLSHGIVNSFIFRVSKMYDYSSLIMSVFPTRLWVLEDPAMPRSTQILLTLSFSLCPGFCVPLLLTIYAWDPRLLVPVCMQHRKPEVPGSVQIPGEGLCQWLTCTGVWKTNSLALNWESALESDTYSRQAVTASCGTLPEITSLLDFIPFPSLSFTLLLVSPESVSLRITAQESCLRVCPWRISQSSAFFYSS